MKKFYSVTWIVFWTGIIFQFLQWPGTVLVILTGSMMFLIHSVWIWYSNSKTGLSSASAWLHTSIALISIYITGRLHFWIWAKFVFYMACIFALITLIFILVRRNRISFSQVFFACYFAFLLWFSYVPSYRLYYAIRLNGILNSESRNYDYLSWDKYSWFLNIRYKKAEALEANKKAFVAASLSAEKGDSNATAFLKQIDQHQFQLYHNQWTDYP